VDEIRDLIENTLLEQDEQGERVGLSIEHAGKRMDLDKVILSELPGFRACGLAARS